MNILVQVNSTYTYNEINKNHDDDDDGDIERCQRLKWHQSSFVGFSFIQNTHVNEMGFSLIFFFFNPFILYSQLEFNNKKSRIIKVIDYYDKGLGPIVIPFEIKLNKKKLEL